MIYLLLFLKSRGDRRDPQRGPMHTSTAVVVVFITDVNDNKPVFKDCSSYAPKIEEGAPNGSPVIKVHAEDEDKGVNGQVSKILNALFKLIVKKNCVLLNKETYKSIIFLLGPIFNSTAAYAKRNKIQR